ncbi:MAG: ubiquinol-cytochrome c reductase iron-sulfur subunit [Candidatus Poribacteria bacterium]|nr:ubiquinol-cytochrome c reductase iron-sulfur subunit [Candidatus Poribacteria bacterium]MDE0505233.1 ubiquinol-cytochrome c reductase iron-sulfur subunit [Candidatus Poribacteria bacterium]
MNLHADKAESSPRRSFVKASLFFIGGLINTVIAVPLLGFAILPALRNKPRKFVVLGIVDLLKGSRYKKVNYTFQSKDGWVKTNKKRSVYVTDTGNGNFVVFSRVCSHLNCLVRWEESKRQFLCPCHGGVFDEEGDVVEGPPPKALERLPVKVEDGVLYVKET